jgi:hypothetical protein
MIFSTTVSVVFVILLIALVLIVCFLFQQIQEQYQQKDPILIEIRNRLMMLSPQAEGLQYYEDNKSYTINKRKIYLCLRDQKNDYYSLNMLTYVSIHELAHVICDEVGHTPKFHKIFSELLDKAILLGLYDPTEPLIQDYCDFES